MSYHLKFLSSDKVEQLREIDAAIKELKQQRFALIRPSQQSMAERNMAITSRLAAGESVASLCAEYQLGRARIHEIAAKVKLKARRGLVHLSLATPLRVRGWCPAQEAERSERKVVAISGLRRTVHSSSARDEGQSISSPYDPTPP